MTAVIPKAVIFDCDGVVMDSEPISFALLSEQLALHGKPLSHAEMRALFLGGTLRSFWEGARAIGAALPDDWVAAQYDRMFARLALGTPLVPASRHGSAACHAGPIGPTAKRTRSARCPSPRRHSQISRLSESCPDPPPDSEPFSQILGCQVWG